MLVFNAPLAVHSTLPNGVLAMYATASKVDLSTGLITHTWDTAAGDWTAVASITIADAKFPLVQETTWTSSYQVTLGTLGGHTGPVVLRLHNDADDAIFAAEVVQISAGYVVAAGPAATALDPVPAIRTWFLANRGEGLEGASVRQIQAGESKVYAMDFRDDLRKGLRLSAIGTVEPEVTTSDFVITPIGVDYHTAKFRVTAIASPTAGEHTIRCKVTYSNGDTVEGDGRLYVAT